MQEQGSSKNNTTILIEKAYDRFQRDFIEETLLLARLPALHVDLILQSSALMQIL